MLPSPDAAWVGEELARRFGLPPWQLAMSATDANRFVLRFARAPDRAAHGSRSWTGATTAPSTRPSPSSTATGSSRARAALGPQVDVALTTAVVPFNDADALDRRLAEGDVACLLMEPALTNIGIVLPEPGYLDAVREITRRHGVLLVIDETHTLCAGPGGCTAAWDLDPDFVVVGKPIGGGIPAAAYGMTAEIGRAARSARCSATRSTWPASAGTLTGNALALAAIRATLSTCLREEDFAVAVPLAERFTDGVAAVIADHDLPWHVQRLGCRAEYWFCPPPRDGAAAAAAVDEDLEGFLHLWCLNRGVLLTPFHNMALFSPHHTESDVDRHTEVFGEAVAALLG